MDCCPLCRDRDSHLFFKDKMAGRFEREYKRARDEYRSLKQLFDEVCWYNFEIQCKSWRDPWPESLDESRLTLHGYRLEVNGGRVHGCWPVYYSGYVKDAHPVPLLIVLTELSLAWNYMKDMEVQQTAPYDWAPGGYLYEKLVKTTAVGKRISSDSVIEDDCGGE